MMNDPNDMIFQEADTSRRRDLETPFEGRGGPKFRRRVVWRPKPSGLSDNAVKKGSRKIIGAAADCAKRGGAAMAEACTVDADSPSRRFMGLVPAFESMGFEDVGMAGKRRHVLRMATGGRGCK